MVAGSRSSGALWTLLLVLLHSSPCEPFAAPFSGARVPLRASRCSSGIARHHSSNAVTAATAVSQPLRQLRTATPPRMQLTAAAGTALTFNSAQLRAALMPILWIISVCAVAMVPSALKVLFSKSKRGTLHRRAFTGFTLGVLVSLWIFSGTYTFLSFFAIFAVIAQNEYYYMARENGVYPTWKLGLSGSVGMYIAACSSNPVLRDALFPMTGTITIVYLLLRREKKTPPTTMNDISTTFVSAPICMRAAVCLARHRSACSRRTRVPP